MAHPSTVGEWDMEIANTSDADLLAYRAALLTLREWPSFKEAFAWIRMFVLALSIDQELDNRLRAKR